MYVTPSAAGLITEPSGADRVFLPFLIGSVRSNRWL